MSLASSFAEWISLAGFNAREYFLLRRAGIHKNQPFLSGLIFWSIFMFIECIVFPIDLLVIKSNLFISIWVSKFEISISSRTSKDILMHIIGIPSMYLLLCCPYSSNPRTTEGKTRNTAERD
jgi:hypothetical protein